MFSFRSIESCLALVLIIFSSSLTNAQVPYKPESNFVEGGQFKDLFLPMPITKKLTSKKLWGAEGSLPRDVKNGIEDNVWSYWGGNPILGDDGKYHIAICRWREETGHWGWPKSEVAHAVSKNPTGPYKITGTALEKGHNPEVIKLSNGKYILHISGAKVYSSDKAEGPWEFLGKLKIDQRGHKGLSHLETNLTGVERKDGSFLFFTKRGDVMISNKGILGPYEIVSAHNYSRYTGYPEDPVIWKSLHQYHVVYNHAVEKKSVYMRSLDGINWIIEPGTAYDNSIFRYADGTKNTWAKFERPKVLQDELGRATHLSLGVIDVEKHLDLGNDNHSSKHIILPLLKEKIIEIENREPINAITKKVSIRIKAENNFDPIKDVNLSSLILGTSNVVNYGDGAKAEHSFANGNDLIVEFQWNGSEIPPGHYDLKLIGKTNNDELLYGFALLPGFSDDPASLVTVPVKIEEENVLSTSVENFGLKTSSVCQLKIYCIKDLKKDVLKVFDIPSLKPYEEFKLELPLKGNVSYEYEAVIVDAEKESASWNKVDDNHYTVIYNGKWNINNKGKDIYMGSEQVSVQKNASATFFFDGTGAKCFGHISKQMGSCDVFIDDHFIETINCYFGADIHNMVIYQTPILPKGLHKLELRVNGNHYKGNEKGPIAIDAFSYR